MFLVLACAKDEPAAESLDFESGAFDFQTLNAKDECLQGALEAFFMPEGQDVPHDFEYPIYIPSYAELPVSYDIDLREPFVEMPVTVQDGGDGWFAVRGSVMEAVRLDEKKYGDCDVTMTVDADLKPTDADTVDGQAWIAVSDARGEEERCPVFAADPCTVTLDLHATRQ